MFVDLDDFKTVNDSLGHAVGDRVLLEVAQRVSASIRAADTAARFGGDEFAVLLEDVHDPQAAVETAERILEALSSSAGSSSTTTSSIRASLGISVAEPGDATDADELIRNADAAMYIAKARGQGRLPGVRARHARAGSSPASSCAPTCSARSSATSSSCTTSRSSASGRRGHRRRGAAALAPPAAA